MVVVYMLWDAVAGLFSALFLVLTRRWRTRP